MNGLHPRVVIVSRQTEYAGLLAAHSTRGQAEFFLRTRGQSIGEFLEWDRIEQDAIAQVRQAVPPEWSFARVMRDDLDRFLFFPNDIVLAVGQDGLVANLARYLDGQPVIGINPDPDRGEGVLTTGRIGELPGVLAAVRHGEARISARAMVHAKIGAAPGMVALNELFIGHRSHQSARYVIRAGGREEFQSSSGLIVSTGTGLTGWARSIMAATGQSVDISPQETAAAFFTREPWPGRNSGCKIRFGEIRGRETLAVLSWISEGGVIFADGIEQDSIPFNPGDEVLVGMARRRLNLVQ
jgi:hypothetical protein